MTSYDAVPFDRVTADLRDGEPDRNKADEMAKHPRGHNWASNAKGEIRVFEPLAGRSIGFSSGGHTGGPYCLRCQRLYCIGCNSRAFGQRCPSLNPTISEEDDE
jgi:hypothetical protein